jgi:hypothetical protein
MANIQCQALTATTLNDLQTQVNNFFSTHPENEWAHLISFDYGLMDGEYTAMILFCRESEEST